MAIVGQILGAEYLANFGFPLPARPVFAVEVHVVDCSVDGRFLGTKFQNRITADEFLGLGERPVRRGYFSLRKPYASGRGHGSQAAAGKYGAAILWVLAELFYGLQQFLGGWAREFLRVLQQHHESHGPVSFRFGLRTERQPALYLCIERGPLQSTSPGLFSNLSP